VSYGFLQCKAAFDEDLVGGSVFPANLQLPLLEQIIAKSPFVLGEYSSSLPFLAPFLISILGISSVPVIRLCLHLQFFGFLSQSRLLGLDWTDVATLLVSPVFHPIELHISRTRNINASFFDIVSSFEQNSDIKRLLENGKILISNDEE
jgi:hypothetical protein